MSAFTERFRWRSIGRNASLEEVIARLNERMRALQELLNLYADDLEHGPIPGAYFPIQLRATAPAGLTTGPKDLAPISFDAVVRAVYAYTPPAAGSLTIDINNGSGSILTTPLAVNGPVTLNSSADFAGGIISPPDLNLEIDSIDTGTPVEVRVVVMLQNVTRVEDQ